MAGPGRGASALSTVWLCLLLAGPSAGCFTCLVETGVGQRLCWGYVLPNSIRSMDACYRTLERIFGDERVIEAGRVGGGYEQQLKEIMYEVIRPVLQEFDLKRHDASTGSKSGCSCSLCSLCWSVDIPWKQEGHCSGSPGQRAEGTQGGGGGLILTPSGASPCSLVSLSLCVRDEAAARRRGLHEGGHQAAPRFRLHSSLRVPGSRRRLQLRDLRVRQLRPPPGLSREGAGCAGEEPDCPAL